MGTIFTWHCEMCEKKGATNIKPPHEPIVCLFCGHTLKIEAFSDVFLNL